MIGDPVVELTRVYHASAAHRLAHPALSDAANASVYGACARPHGHNYYIEVTVAGRPDPVTGMAVDRAVISRVDHRTLEAVPELAGVITTGESLARAFWRLLAPELPEAALTRVTVVETAKNRFEYEGGAR